MQTICNCIKLIYITQIIINTAKCTNILSIVEIIISHIIKYTVNKKLYSYLIKNTVNFSFRHKTF